MNTNRRKQRKLRSFYTFYFQIHSFSKQFNQTFDWLWFIFLVSDWRSNPRLCKGQRLNLHVSEFKQSHHVIFLSFVCFLLQKICTRLVWATSLRITSQKHLIYLSDCRLCPMFSIFTFIMFTSTVIYCHVHLIYGIKG